MSHITTAIIFLLFFASSHLFGKEKEEDLNYASNVVSYGDVSGIVGGHVNVLSGDFVDSARDLFVPGPSPITIDRFYATSIFSHRSCSLHGSFVNIDSCGHLYEGRYKKNGSEKKSRLFRLTNANGSLHEFVGKRKSGHDCYLASLLRENSLKGYTNSSTGYLSGQTNIINETFSYHRYQKDPICFFGDGKKIVFKKNILKRLYTIDSITFADGNKHQYRYNKHTLKTASIRPEEIINTDSTGKKTFGSITCSYEDAPKGFRRFVARGSNGQEVSYLIRKFAGHHYTTGPDKMNNQTDKSPDKQCIEEVVSTIKPTVKYKWTPAYDSVSKKIEKFLIEKRSLPDNRCLSIEYNGSNQVWQLNAPIGHDANLKPMYCFDYGISETYVYDAVDHKTVYAYPEESRIGSITRYTGKSPSKYKIYSAEHFTWGKDNQSGFLLAHRIEDSEGTSQKSVAYIYDSRGNVVQEVLSGNLSGRCNLSNPEEIESVVTHRTFSKCGKNLLLTETVGNRTIQFNYHPNTNLIQAKYLLIDGKIKTREFYDYNSDKVLVRKIVDDGKSSRSDDLAGVTERHITTIAPSQSPVVGLPEVVEERYYDFEKKKERLLVRKINTYDSYGRLIREETYDAHGDFVGSASWKYDPHGNLLRSRNLMGHTIECRYDNNDNLIWRKGPNEGSHQTFEYDFMNRCVAEKNHTTDGKTYVKQFKYDLLGNKIWEIDICGNRTDYSYDDLNRLVSKTTPCKTKEQYGYNALNQINKIVHPNGSQTTKVLTLRGQEASVHYPDGSSEDYRYDLLGRMIEKRMRNLTTAHYKYDDLDREIECIFYAPNGEALSRTTKRYNAFHLLSETDPNGYRTHYSYDAAGRLIQTKKGDHESRYSYDALGRKTHTYQYFGDGLYCLTEVKYDLLNRVIETLTKDHNGNVLSKERTHYDPDGNIIEVLTDCQAGVARTFTTYDCFGRPLTITDPLGHTTRIDYDDSSISTKKVTDPNGNITKEIYDEDQRLIRIIKYDPFGATTLERSLAYDKEGNLTTQTEIVPKTGKTIVTAWEYDSCNREVTTIEAMGTPEQKITQTTYTLAGEKASQMKPDGVVIHYTYDALGRLIARTASDGSVDDLNHYDLNGNLLIAENRLNGTAVCREYGPNDQLTMERLSNGLTLRYEYDRLGRVTKTVLPDDSAIGYEYDAAFLRRVNRLTREGSIAYSHHYDAYDLSRLPTKETHIGQIGSHTYTYDLCSRVISDLAKHRRVLNNQYDPSGNLCHWHLEDNQGTTDIDFAYDALDQLTKEEGIVTHTYQCDSLSNRIHKDGQTYAVNHLNQILNQQQSHYCYDLNGNRISKITPNGTLYYTYDALNRLTEVITESGTIRYAYDFYHRRISRTENDSTEFYLYREMEEIGSVKNGVIQELKILGLDTVAIELQGVVYGAVSDQFGNLAVLVDPDSGNAVTSYRFGAFGDEVALGTVTSPWRYQQKRHDPGTELVYFGYRDYDIELGSWSTPDPLGFADGPNLYAYVHHNPVMLFDPDGTTSFREYCSLAWDYSCSKASYAYTRTVQFAEEHRVGTRLAGAGRAVCGGIEAAVGGGLVWATGWTGFGGVGGGALITHGADNISTGFLQMYTGREQETLTSKGLQSCGMSPTAANYTSDAIGIIGTGGVYMMTNVIRSATLLGSSGSVLVPRSNDFIRNAVNCTNNGNPSLVNLNRKLISEEIAGGHAFAKHASEFGFTCRSQMAKHIESVLKCPNTKVLELQRGRTAFWDSNTKSVIIRDPSHRDGGTTFIPETGYKYFLRDIR